VGLVSAAVAANSLSFSISFSHSLSFCVCRLEKHTVAHYCYFYRQRKYFLREMAHRSFFRAARPTTDISTALFYVFIFTFRSLPLSTVAKNKRLNLFGLDSGERKVPLNAT